MTFRDNQTAVHEREKAELRDKLAREREENEQLERELAALRQNRPLVDPNEDEEIQEELRKMGVRARKERISGIAGTITDVVLFLPRLFWHTIIAIGQLLGSFFSGFGNVPWQMWIMGAVASVMLGMCVYHEFYDIRDGYITGKTYTPPYTTSSCDKDGHCTTTYHPATWSVTINFEGQGATWGVSEDEYNHLHRGQWYCARDFLHEAPCVQDTPAEF